MRCRRDPDFAASFEEELATLMNVKSIDWSQIDWEQVVKIVLMILAAFGVL
jgi:Tfp pilus assembly protein PilO